MPKEKIIHIDREKRAFEASVETSIEGIEDQYACDILLQGSMPNDRRRIGDRYISCFHGGLTNVKWKKRRAASIKKVIIDHSLPNNQGEGTYDICYLSEPSVEVRYADHNGNTLAFKDTNGNMHFMDFYHIEGHLGVSPPPFPEFFQILEHAWGVPEGKEQAMVSSLEKALKRVSAEKIEKIVLTTSFDKEAYIASTKKEFEKAVQLQRRIDVSKVNTLTRTLEIEREINTKRTDDANAKSFAQGMTFIKKHPNWEIRDNRLYHKLDIYVKQATLGDNVWDIPETEQPKYYIKGLNFLIEPYPSQGKSSYSNHPNISGGGTVCIGDLAGKSLDYVLSKSPKMLEMGGLNSPFNSSAANELRTYAITGGSINEERVKPTKLWHTSSSH